MLLTLISAVLVGLMVAIFVVIGRRGRGRGRGRAGRAGDQRLGPLILLAVGVILLGVIVLPLATVIGDRELAGKRSVGLRLTDREQTGRHVFVRTCGRCHQLRGANTSPAFGPNLDERVGTLPLDDPARDRRVRYAIVRNAIRYGVDRGTGHMPARIVRGADADAVSQFVARVAGR